MINKLLTLLPALFLSATTWGATYYISPNGNDSNSGTSQAQAWRTVARVQQAASSLQPGDQVLFERGGSYAGKLTVNASGTSSQPIIIGAYGSGAKPEISGSVPVGTWIQHQGNIWRASVAQPVKYVWVNNSPMTLARFPNTGWLRCGSASNTHVNSGSLTQGNGHWNGAELVLRTTNWSYENAIISASGNGSVSFPAITFNPGPYDWGFFLQNKLSELDAPGEWFYDQAAGQLYFWAPANANPNNLSVQASVHEHGVEIGWQRQHIRVQDLAFRKQRFSGVHNQGGNHIRVTGCTFEDLFTAIKSYSNNSVYSGNTIRGTFGSGLSLVDNNTMVADNQISEVALHAGLGESAWGYFGLYILGNGNTVRGNNLFDIGYSGIFFEGNTLVEKNVVRDVNKILNDGGGIYFDNASGAIVQDNIISEVNGDLTSTANNHPHRWHMGHGIFFGMGTINNVIVRRNTVSNCITTGMVVDHTMISHNIEVRDNVLFNNTRTQLMITDISNSGTPGGSAPYHQPNFNDVYTGNVLYAASPDQKCMEQFQTYGTGWVDYGSFSNNFYFNPFDERSIVIYNSSNNDQRHYTLEHWQAARGEDAGSTRSPHRQDIYEVTSVLSANLVPNGSFDYNVNSWSGWPTQGQLSHSTNMLDNGSLRVQYATNAGSPEYYLRHTPTSTAVQMGQYYQLKFSLQSNMHGNVRAEFKGQSQAASPNSIFSRSIHFDTERRDVSLVFQSNLSEPGQTFFANHFTESTYWLDNVQLYRVNVQPIDPLERHILLSNDQSSVQTFTLVGCWRDVTGVLHSGTVEISGYSSMVLAKEEDVLCSLSTGLSDEIADSGTVSPTLYPNPVLAGSILNLTTPLTTSASVHFIDVSGRMAHDVPLSAGSTVINVPTELNRGPYVVRITEGSTSRAHRILVQ